MIRTIVKLAVLLCLAVSVFINVLALAGFFHRDLVREKDAVIDRFERRVEELEGANRKLAVTIDIFEKTIAEYAAVHARARREIAAIRAKLQALYAEGQ